MYEYIVAPSDPADSRMMWLEARGYDHALDIATGLDPMRRGAMMFHPEEREGLRVQRVGTDSDRDTSTISTRRT